MGLEIVKIFDTGIEAHILRNKLEGENISAYVFDENIVTLNPLLNFAVGGVKLKVDEADLERAKAIVAEIDDQPYTDEKDKILQCPKCNSTELYSDFKSMKGPTGIISAIVSFVLTVFPIYYKSVYRCKACNTEFKSN